MEDHSDLDLLTNAMHDTHELVLTIDCEDGKWEIRANVGSGDPALTLWWLPNPTNSPYEGCNHIPQTNIKRLRRLNDLLTSALTPKSDEQRADEAYAPSGEALSGEEGSAS